MKTESSKTVLIVDDMEIIAEMVGEYLQRKGYLVHIFDDPEKALRHLSIHGTTVIVSDFQMGAMNGVQFLAQAYTILPEIRAVLMTSEPGKLTSFDIPWPVIEKCGNFCEQIAALIESWE